MPLTMRPTGPDKDRPDYTVYCGGWRTARCMIRPQYEPRRWPMALQGEAKKLYHREYMRRRRAGLPTRGVVKPMVMEQWCSECVLPPSPERLVISLGSGYRLCESCYEAAGALFAAERAMGKQMPSPSEDR
jgi:hypothetical protein